MNGIAASNEQASEFLKYALKGLDEQGVRYCAQRNYEGYPSTITGDVDLVVSGNDIKTAASIIREVAESRGWIQFHSYAWTKTAYLGFSKSIYPERFALVIELFAGACWHGLEYISAENILSHRVRVNEVWGPSSFHQALVTLIHHLLYNNTVPEKYRDEISRLVSLSETSFISCVDEILINRQGGFFFNAIKSDRWDELSDFIFKLKLSIILKNLYRAPISTLSTVYDGYKAKSTVGNGIIILLNLRENGDKLADTLMYIADKWHLYMPTKRKVFHQQNMQIADVLNCYRAGGLAIIVGNEEATQLADCWLYEIQVEDQELTIFRDQEVGRIAVENSFDGAKLASLIFDTVLTDSAKRLLQ